MKIAMENHADFTVRELASILARVGSPAFGFTLDSANLAFDLDDPLRLAQIMAPYTLDHALQELPHHPHAAGPGPGELRAGRRRDRRRLHRRDARRAPSRSEHQHRDPLPVRPLHAGHLSSETFFQRHPSPPGDGLAWYLKKAWQKADPRDDRRTTCPTASSPGNWNTSISRQSVALGPGETGAHPVLNSKEQDRGHPRNDRQTGARKSAWACWAAASWASATPTPTRRSPTSTPTPASCRGCPSSATRTRRSSPREAARYGYEEYCTDWNELVRDDRIDVFDNCGPDPVHPDPCIAALENGKHVICEKPMAVSVDDARRMRDAAAAVDRQGDVHLQLSLHARRATGQGPDRRRQDRHDLPDAGQLPADGRTRSVAAPRPGLVLPPGRIRAACRASAATPSTSAGFWSARSRACRPWCGPSTPTGPSPAPATPSATSDEGTAALFEFENGAIGVLESSVVATGRKNFLSWEINGSAGSLRWDLEHPNSLFACLPGAAGGSLSGFTEISVDRKRSSVRRPLVAARPQHRLGALPHHREVPLPRRRGQRQADEPLQRHLRGRLPRGRDHRRHAPVEPLGNEGRGEFLRSR